MKSNVKIGRRKKAVAKATYTEGTGIVKFNGKPIDLVEPEMVRMMLMEPIMLAGDVAGKINIDVNAEGGGVVSQAEAARQAISLSLVDQSKKLEKAFDQYDKNMLVADARRTEPHKPGPSSPRKHKQRSKR